MSETGRPLPPELFGHGYSHGLPDRHDVIIGAAPGLLPDPDKKELLEYVAHRLEVPNTTVRDYTEPASEPSLFVSVIDEWARTTHPTIQAALAGRLLDVAYRGGRPRAREVKVEIRRESALPVERRVAILANRDATQSALEKAFWPD